MKHLNIFLFCCGLLAVSGCSKFLDIKPKDKFIPTTVSDYENMLNSGNMVNYGDYFEDLITDDVFLPEGEPGNQYSAMQPGPRRIYTFNPNVYEQGTLDPMWSESYKRIFYCNSIINNIMTAEGGTDAYKRSVRAEALLGRAMEFLQLVNIYAQHYDKATAATQPGIPLALIADITGKFNRNSVQEVYNQIISDANEAIPDLPAKFKNTKFRACKAGGYALLSRVYLFMGEFEKAGTAATQALALQSTLVDMNTYKIIIPGPFPNVPGSPVGWTDMPEGKLNVETIVARHFLRPFGLGALACASPELTALFNANDRRWALYYADGWPPAPPFNYMNRYGVRIYLRGDFYSNYLNVPELYLNRAETYARAGNMQKALDDINLLRKNRIVPAAYTVLTPTDFSNDAEKVLRFVLDERRRELAFSGMRVIDLKRLNKETRFQKTIKHTAEGKQYELLPNSNNYVRQIWPDAAIFNPDWPLNP